MLQVFYLDVVYVAMAIHAYVQEHVSYILDICCKCFIWMLHMLQMTILQVYILNVSYVLGECCICFV
jgi:hypothetical protein